MSTPEQTEDLTPGRMGLLLAKAPVEGAFNCICRALEDEQGTDAGGEHYRGL